MPRHEPGLEGLGPRARWGQAQRECGAATPRRLLGTVQRDARSRSSTLRATPLAGCCTRSGTLALRHACALALRQPRSAIGSSSERWHHQGVRRPVTTHPNSTRCPPATSRRRRIRGPTEVPEQNLDGHHASEPHPQHAPSERGYHCVLQRRTLTFYAIRYRAVDRAATEAIERSTRVNPQDLSRALLSSHIPCAHPLKQP